MLSWHLTLDTTYLEECNLFGVPSLVAQREHLFGTKGMFVSGKIVGGRES